MQISLSVPSTPQAAEAGAGADALFEEVTAAFVGKSDGDLIESFDALIQAALAAIGGTVPPTAPAPLPSTVDAVATGEKPPADLGSISRPGNAEIPGPTEGAAAGPHGADRVRDEVQKKSASPANSADAQAARQADLDQMVVDSTNRPDNELRVDQTRPDQVVEEEETSDNVMIVVEEAMESFTPIPVSVLALLRADAVTSPASTGAVSPAGSKGQQPLPASRHSPASLSADEPELLEESFLAPVPAVEFVAARGTETGEFSNTFESFAEERSETTAPDAPATTWEQPVQTPLPVAASSAPDSGHERLPVVPATREAVGAFAIEQIVSRAKGREDEPVSRIEARIDPPELGRISIEISKTSEGLSAHLTVDDPSVLALLDQQMREVQQTLEAAGVPMTSLTMSAGSERDAPQQDARRDDEELSFAAPARRSRPAGARSTTSRREIDTTA